MLGLFAVIKDKIKPKFGSHCIDNWVFQLHYRATTIIFLIATILVTSREYVGEHIKCISNMHADGFSKVVETFCFFTSTFTVISDHKYGAGQIAHPGVHPYGIESTQPVKKHFYYQWVPFLLFGQAIMFYLTHLLWKKLEGGRIDKLVAGLDNSAFALLDKTMQVENRTIPTKEEKNACISRIKNAFLQRIILNKSWARWFIFCEILNVLNVVFQAYITHLFLGKQFYSLGPDVVNRGSEVLDEVFPKVTKCTFHKYGPSGSLQLHDVLCIMALNIINEKIYVFLWFWFVFLFIVSCLILAWRFATFFLYSRSNEFNRFIFGNTSKGKLYVWHVKVITQRFNYADWLLLKYLSKNMDSLSFRELFMNLSEDLEEKKPLLYPNIKSEVADIYKFE